MDVIERELLRRNRMRKAGELAALGRDAHARGDWRTCDRFFAMAERVRGEHVPDAVDALRKGGERG
jgi:hypothetical protein